MKAAMGILTTDLKPKITMEECYIGNKLVKIYGIAKGSGMIYPNMATTLGFVFTDATISSNILKQLLKTNIQRTFNAISCDGDTSTNDMVSLFATSKVANKKMKNDKPYQRESVRSFAVKYILSVLLCISVYIHFLTHDANRLLKKEKELLVEENKYLMYEGAKLYESYQRLIELIRAKIKEEEQMRRRQQGLEA